VAEGSGRVLRFAEIYLRHPEPKNLAIVPKLYAHLQSLSVTEAFRHKGIGNQLLKAAEVWARDHFAIELRLDIWEISEIPLRFYEKSGYRTFRRALAKNL
jgi:GNAT superfamily N-acetyltransferase